jgi:lipoyl(octanoyl) transferase
MECLPAHLQSSHLGISNSNAHLNLNWLGLCNYDRALEIQSQCHDEVLSGGNEVILAMEHPLVVTLGKRGSLEHVAPHLWNSVRKTDRGGQVTLHSPGQLVIYPIVSLLRHHLSVRDFVCLLMKTTSQVLQEIDVPTQLTDDQAGLVDLRNSGKIAFCGIRVENGVTRHGISININNDLELFRGIVPCGMSSMAMSRTDSVVPLKSVAERWAQIFSLSCAKAEINF